MEDIRKVLEQTCAYAVQYVESCKDMPAFPSEKALAGVESLRGPMPEEPCDPCEVVDLLGKYAQPATAGNLGGHYYGFVSGSLLPAAHAAQWFIDTWNQNSCLYTGSPAAAVLEDIAEKWVAELFGFPEGTAMGLATGSSNCILIALIAARNELIRRQGWDVFKQGYKNAPSIRIVLGAGAHGAVRAALYYLGIGEEELEFVPIDEYGRMIPEKVPPLDDHTLLILQAGNVCGGAYDPLEKLIAKANKAGAWVHVDGAFGLWAAVSPNQAHYVKGIGNADSCNMDVHKTLNGGYDSSIVLCRDRRALRSAMEVGGSYLQFSEHRDNMGYVTEMSRRPRGVVLWAALKQLGKKGLADMIDNLCDCTSYFAEKMVEAGFVMTVPPFFNQFFVKCDTEEHTKAVLAKVQASTKAWSGSAMWDGEFVMRFSICSYKTTHQDIDESVAVYKAALDEVCGK